MAFRRQKLTQRRKAVGFTQESLAEHLGVERSTVIRWEAGDSEPLPSIRPSLARALQVSIDQLADLLTRSVDAGTGRALSADPEEAAPVSLTPEAQPPGGSQLDNAVHPQVAETVEALRRALRSAGVSAEDLAAMLLVSTSPRAPLGAPGSDVPAPFPTESTELPAQTTVPPDIEPGEDQQRRSGSWTGKRFAAAGLFVLALPAAWLSPPFGSSPGGAGFQAGAGTLESAAPVVAGQTLHPDRGTDSSPRPADAPGDVDATPADGPAASPGVAAVPASQTTKAIKNSRTTRRSSRSAITNYSPPREWLRPATVAGDRWGGVGRIERFSHLW